MAEKLKTAYLSVEDLYTQTY